MYVCVYVMCVMYVCVYDSVVTLPVVRMPLIIQRRTIIQDSRSSKDSFQDGDPKSDRLSDS